MCLLSKNHRESVWDDMKAKLQQIATVYGTQLLLGLIALPIGGAIGAVDALFGRLLLAITAFRDAHVLPLVLFLPLAGVVIAYSYLRFGGSSAKGMNLVFAVGHGEERCIPLRLIPFVMVGTWMTHLFGGSAGREGVAVQIGATLSHWVGRHLPLKESSDVFLLVGMAAGFAGLFRTPIAAVFFALEVLVAGELKYRALFPALIACLVSSQVSGWLGLEKFQVALTCAVPWDLGMLVRLLVLGVLFGLAGGFFARGLGWLKGVLAAKLPNPLLRIALAGLALIPLLLLLHGGRYCGLGTNLIQASFNGQTIYPYDWLCKLALTILTLAAGYQGGEVTPLFSIGASLGVVLAGILGLPVELAAALGYAALFGSATNTLLAPILIGAEIFGFAYLPYFFVVCCVGYVCNFNQSIYGKQKQLREKSI